jgi:DNA-binding FrmR family transcriptional regulator
MRDTGVGTEEITNRLKRVEGQVRGLQRMVDDQRDCEAILTQLLAARSALDRVGLMIAENFVQECFIEGESEVMRQRAGRVWEMVFSRFSIPTGQQGAASWETGLGEEE